MSDSFVASYMESHFDPDGLNGMPWQPEHLEHETFRAKVQAVLDREGRWSTSGEFAMGGDINVSIERVPPPDAIPGSEWATLATRGYDITAECGLKINARYQSLEKALGMLTVFAHLTWDFVSKTDAWRDLIFHVE